MLVDPMNGIIHTSLKTLTKVSDNIRNENSCVDFETHYFLGHYKLVVNQNICLTEEKEAVTTYKLYRSHNCVFGIEADTESYVFDESDKIKEICEYGSQIDKLYNAISWLKLQYEIDFKKLSDWKDSK